MDGGRTDVERLLPDYQLDVEVGRGQQGVVWRGRHRELQRPVAIKQLTALSGDHAARFRREARVLAQVSHPHVVSVFDYRESSDLRVIVMELLDAGTFADRRRDGLTPGSAVAATLVASTGLAQVHRQGILHRDVKPDNLMFDSGGRLKVTDFGLARDDLVDATRVDLTHVGAFFGTPGYVAPEQAGYALATGWPPVSAASDQYSLAAVLYEALSGRLTHDASGGALALCQRRMNTEAEPLDAVAPTVPAPIARVVARALRRDPNERYDSVESFGVELARAAVAAWGSGWMADTEVPLLSPGRVLAAASGPPAPPEPAGDGTGHDSAPSGRRWRRRSLAGIAGLIVVVGAGVGALVLRPDDSVEVGDEPTFASAVAGEAALDLVEVWSVPTGAAVFSSPAVATEPAGERAVVGSRDGTVYAVDVATGQVAWTYAAGDEVRSSPAVADGVAYIGSDDGYLDAVMLDDGSLRWRAPVGFQIVSSPAVADGTVVVGADRLYAFDAATGEPRWDFAPTDVVASSPAVADGMVFVGSDDGTVYALSLADGTQRWARATGGPVQSSPAVAGGAVYVGGTDGSLYALDVASGADRWVRDLGSPIKSSPAVEGQLVYVGTDAGRLSAVNTATGHVVWSTVAPDRLDSSPVVVDGLVAIGCNDGVVYVASAIAGNPLGAFATGGPVLSSPAATGRGLVVGSNDGNIYLIGGLNSPRA